jgi:intracellular sulfur oxidation DsrE/DsrF family protein
MSLSLTTLKALLLCTVLAAIQPVLAQQVKAPTAAVEPVKVVYHLSEGIEQASRAIVNIGYHLDADPTAKIVVVTHGAGIDFLLEGAARANKQSFEGSIGALSARGVEFRVCNNTLVSRNIDASKVVMEVKVVPSGVSEVARLQAREGYAYLHP